MTDRIRRALHFAAAIAAAVSVSNASATIATSGGDVWVQLDNHSKVCVRAYVKGHAYDVSAGKHKNFVVDDNDAYHKYLVSVYRSSSCGGKAAKNLWFDNMTQTWSVWK